MRATSNSLWASGLVLFACTMVGHGGGQSAVGQIASPEGPALPLVMRGQVVIEGKSTPYLIRYLPVTSFPELPVAVATALNQRGCAIPQTYEAHRPENVVRGSFEKAGSSDWAVLCSVKGTVTLMVFFGAPEDGAAQPQVVNSAAETARLYAHDSSGILGFDWGIDAATPERMHEVESGLNPRPPTPDHDVLADSWIDRLTIYHLYKNRFWVGLQIRE